MEKKNYKNLNEEENTAKASEPTTSYAATGSGFTNTLMEDEVADDFLDRIPLGKLGFYTDDPDVFEARIAEIEADMDEVEAGYEDPEKWVSSEQMDEELRKQFPWLR